MSKATSIEIIVNMRLDADIKTAETCLRVVEAYINAHGLKVVQEELESGEVDLNYEPFAGVHGTLPAD